jgi:hypothetical protein
VFFCSIFLTAMFKQRKKMMVTLQAADKGRIREEKATAA